MTAIHKKNQHRNSKIVELKQIKSNSTMGRKKDMNSVNRSACTSNCDLAKRLYCSLRSKSTSKKTKFGHIVLLQLRRKSKLRRKYLFFQIYIWTVYDRFCKSFSRVLLLLKQNGDYNQSKCDKYPRMVNRFFHGSHKKILENKIKTLIPLEQTSK